MKSWNSNERFEDILCSNQIIQKYLNLDELNKVLKSEDKIDNIDWIYKNKF